MAVGADQCSGAHRGREAATTAPRAKGTTATRAARGNVGHTRVKAVDGGQSGRLGHGGSDKARWQHGHTPMVS